MDERPAIRLVRWTGAAVFALALAMLAGMPTTAVRKNLDGVRGAVVGFELVATPEEVLDILGHAGDPDRAATIAAMDRTNRIDFLFMIAYPALFVAIAGLLVARGLAPTWLIHAIGLLAFLMAVGDFIENRQLLMLSRTTDPAAMAGPLLVLWPATRMKWAALFVAAILTGVYVRRDRTWWRWSALGFVAAGAVGLVGFLWLPGMELGGNLVGLAWLVTWVHALRSRRRSVRPSAQPAKPSACRTRSSPSNGATPSR
jgi:hypothetical protein